MQPHADRAQIAAPGIVYGMLALGVSDVEALAASYEVRAASASMRAHLTDLKRDLARDLNLHVVVLFGRFWDQEKHRAHVDVGLVMARHGRCGHWMAKSILSQAGPDTPLTDEDVERMRRVLPEVCP